MKFLINQDVYAKVMYLVHKCDEEISGLGRVKIEGEAVRIVDMVLLDQEVTGGTTDLSANAVSTALYEAYKDGGLAKGEMLWWWHSHVNMGVFWSGTDMSTIKEFGGKGRIFATVFNKKAEMRSAYFQAGTEVYPELFVDNIATSVDFGLLPQQITDLDTQFKAKVKKKTYNYGGYGQNYRGPNWNKNNKGKNKVSKNEKANQRVSSWNDPFYWDDDEYMGFSNGWDEWDKQQAAREEKLVTSQGTILGGKREKGNK